ncbi:MAG: hypothetical protein M3Y52_06650 [Actinomycetota bacterium]|nr:hypothetical protein [Actinomycetota bacterium]
MTSDSGAVAAALIAEAQAMADAADARAGIVTRPARVDELDGVLARFDATWGAGRGPDRATLQAMDHAGNTVLVAVPATEPDDATSFTEPGDATSFTEPVDATSFTERVDATSFTEPVDAMSFTEPVDATSFTEPVDATSFTEPVDATSFTEPVEVRSAGGIPPTASGSSGRSSTGSATTTPLGATLGFLGWNNGVHLHSHMNAVDPAARGRGIGVALKLRQRAICLAHGVTDMRWTYDPLIRRNAHLNLVRLGAEVIAFHPDFYGELRDAITGADHSDRFEVRWRLDAPRTARALAGRPAPEWRARGGLPLVADFEHVRAEDPEVATRLRRASREAFAALAADPALRVELDANGDYVFTSDDPDREA